MTTEDQVRYPRTEDFIVDPPNIIPQSKIDQMIHSYLKTFNWIFRYYTYGNSSIDTEWCYRYYHAPIITDIVKLIDTPDYNIGQHLINYQSRQDTIPFTPLHQLLAVIPAKSKNILPIELLPLYDENSILQIIFPQTLLLNMMGLIKSMKEYL